MLRQLTGTGHRLNDIAACLAPALELLKDLDNAFGPPYVHPITNTVEALINVTQVRSSKLGQTRQFNMVA
jgi:hypothetical protein